MPMVERWLRRYGFCLARKTRRRHADSPRGEELVSEAYTAWRREGDYVTRAYLVLWLRGRRATSGSLWAAKANLKELRVLPSGTVEEALFMYVRAVPRGPAGLEAVLERIAKALEKRFWVRGAILEPDDWLTIAASPCIYTPCIDLVLAILLEL